MKSSFFLALRGIPVTLFITVMTLLISIPIAFAIAVARAGKKRKTLNLLFSVYVSAVRGTPVIVQILIIYTMLPDLLKFIIEKLALPFNVYAINNIFYAILIFSFSMIAFLSEVFRAGLRAVGRGQYEAALAAGLSGFRAYTRIIAPQAFSAVLPVLCTSVNNLIKTSSLCFAIAVNEITGIIRVAASRNLHFVEGFLVIAAIYVIICMAVELCFKILENKAKVHRVSA
jgi:L-cystine transport system permease protein